MGYKFNVNWAKGADSHINDNLLNTWQGVQDAFGQPLDLVSGYRSPKRNANAGGAKKSQHMHGNAIDVNTRNLSHADRLKLFEIASSKGMTGVGVYNNNMHFDLGGRRGWGADYHRGSVPSWAKGTMSKHLSNGYAGQPQATGFSPSQPQETNTVPPAMQEGQNMQQTMSQPQRNPMQGIIDALQGNKSGEALPDPNYTSKLADQLMNGATATPVAGNFDGIGRLAMMLSGGMKRGQYEDDLKRQKNEKSALADAVMGKKQAYVNANGGEHAQGLANGGFIDEAFAYTNANNTPKMLQQREQTQYDRGRDGIQDGRNDAADALAQDKFTETQSQNVIGNERNTNVDALSREKFDASQVPQAPTPLSPTGKVNADVANNFVDQGTADSLIAKAITPSKGVTVNTGGNENSYATKKLTDMDVKNYGTQVSSAEKLMQLAPEVNRIAQLSTQTTTGGTGEMKLKLAQLLNIDYEGKEEAELIKAITSRLAPAMRPTGSGSSSNKDVSMFLTSLPQLLNSPGGSAIIAETITKIGQRRMEEANIKRRLIDEGQVQNYANEVSKLQPLFESDYFDTDPTTMSDDDLRAQIEALESQ